ncbi:MAG: tetratricopeptide repeat protein [Oligoflexales bacterium]
MYCVPKGFLALFLSLAALIWLPRLNAQTLNEANDAFAKGQFDSATRLYRTHLRDNPEDYNAWTLLGATYYETGQFKKALSVLKRTEKKLGLLPTNFYYQGMCYRALNKRLRSKRAFTKASIYNDAYAKAAIFQLIATEYKDQNKKLASYWIDQYVARFPDGEHIAIISELKQSLAVNKFDYKIEQDLPSPDNNKALFKYSKYSLFNYPHYWFSGIGFLNTFGTQNNPHPQKGLEKEEKSTNELDFEAGIGVGPFVEGNSQTFVGYHYTQNWVSDEDRIKTYFDDPLDFAYFPYRSDLLTRRHRLLADFKKKTNKYFYFGLFAAYEFARSGSTFFPVPDENKALKQTLNVSRTSLVVPWVGLEYNSNNRSMLYMYFEKEIDSELPEFSNKTYNFNQSSIDKSFSLGVKHRMDLPQFDTGIEAEFFRYDYTYNDYWLDYQRTGFLLTVEHEVISEVTAIGMVGTFQDVYDAKYLRSKSCSGVVTASTTQAGDIHQCARNDAGLVYKLNLAWTYTPTKRIEGFISYVEVKNPELQVFDRTDFTLGLMFTFSFPQADSNLVHKQSWGDTKFYSVR